MNRLGIEPESTFSLTDALLSAWSMIPWQVKFDYPPFSNQKIFLETMAALRQFSFSPV